MDDARGVAVVLMILWHTVDGWIRPSLKSGPGFDGLRLFGGTAAPLFLALAGAGAAMKLASDRARGVPVPDRMREQVARGLHVMTVGYSLRAFMWLVDGAAFLRLGNAPAFVPLVLGLGFTLRGLERLGPGRPRGATYTALGVLLYGTGVIALLRIAPNEVVHVLRVDVLQAIGISLTSIALLDPLLDLSGRPWLAIAVGFLVALATSTMERTMPAGLPPAIAGIVSQWPTAVGRDIARFPLFPWLGYALVGAGVGAIWFRAATVDRALEGMLSVMVVAALVASLSSVAVSGRFFALPPALQKPVFMLYKIGVGLAISGLVSIFCELVDRAPLRDLGKTSMLIYWVHLELVYGLSGKPFVRMLDYREWAVGFVALTLLMALAARLRAKPPRLLDGLGRRILRE